MTASYSSPAGVCRYYSHIVSYNIPIFPHPLASTSTTSWDCSSTISHSPEMYDIVKLSQVLALGVNLIFTFHSYTVLVSLWSPLCLESYLCGSWYVPRYFMMVGNMFHLFTYTHDLVKKIFVEIAKKTIWLWVSHWNIPRILNGVISKQNP